MAKVSAHIGKQLYKTEIKSSLNNFLIADEPQEKGGQNLGFGPTELLAASLAACTCATVRMYAERKNWELNEINVDVELNRDEAQNKTIINRQVQFIGNLNEEQLARLLHVANACPVHKILSNPIEINTTTLPSHA